MGRSEALEPEEETFDLRRLGRVALWGGGAALTVLLVVLAAQSETGARRMALALGGLPPQVRPASPVGTDRERLLARLEALERAVDVTGSIPPAPAASPGKGSPQLRSVSPEAAESVATKTEFGVDLGGDVNLDALRAIWSVAKAQHGAALEGLRPLVAVRENGKAGPVELRLVAGPLSNAAAAARLCAALAGSELTCQPTTFDGQRLALR